MNLGGNSFIIAIIAICTIGWVITTAIRARHGYPVSDDWGNTIYKEGGPPEDMKRLVAENEQLRGTVGKLEERLKVLERIATDPSRRLAEDIEQLRTDPELVSGSDQQGERRS